MPGPGRPGPGRPGPGRPGPGRPGSTTGGMPGAKPAQQGQNRVGLREGFFRDLPLTSLMTPPGPWHFDLRQWHFDLQLPPGRLMPGLIARAPCRCTF